MDKLTAELDTSAAEHKSALETITKESSEKSFGLQGQLDKPTAELDKSTTEHRTALETVNKESTKKISGLQRLLNKPAPIFETPTRESSEKIHCRAGGIHHRAPYYDETLTKELAHHQDSANTKSGQLRPAWQRYQKMFLDYKREQETFERLDGEQHRQNARIGALEEKSSADNQTIPRLTLDLNAAKSAVKKQRFALDQSEQDTTALRASHTEAVNTANAKIEEQRSVGTYSRICSFCEVSESASKRPNLRIRCHSITANGVMDGRKLESWI